ncbi:MAG: ClpXP protease specificity-enhancing factor [Candidatus Rariloculaceae bacterium]
MVQVKSKRPYLIRAMHEWMTDNGLTPYVVIDAGTDDLKVPEQYISEDKLICNISYSATRNLDIADDRMSFETRFDGVIRHIDVPIVIVIGIYAKETGQGMIFSEDESTQLPDTVEISEPGSAGRPTLKIVK